MNRIDVPIAQLSFSQKLDLMEMLWADMTGNEKELESPAWHGEILNEREAALNAGKKPFQAGKKQKKESGKTSHEPKPALRQRTLCWGSQVHSSLR